MRQQHHTELQNSSFYPIAEIIISQKQHLRACLNQTFYLQIKTVQSIAQYKPFITSALQRFSVTCGSILHLKINILIYIYRLISVFPCTVFLNRHRQRYDWYEKNPFFRIRKSGLLPPELRGLTRRSPLLRTQKSLVSRFTQILHDRPHLQGSQHLLPLPPTVTLQLRL